MFAHLCNATLPQWIHSTLCSAGAVGGADGAISPNARCRVVVVVSATQLDLEFSPEENVWCGFLI